MQTIKYCFIVLVAIIITNCSEKIELKAVSVADFKAFVKETDYLTDAEKYGWSIVQEDIQNFRVLEKVDWRIPNGQDSSRMELPVTQVSFNDALAYCNWKGVRLPTYDEYWELVQSDNRSIVKGMAAVLPIENVNIVGNTWDITTTERSNGEIRLAGGSYLCNDSTCNGTSPGRLLYVDKATGNVHISFSVIE